MSSETKTPEPVAWLVEYAGDIPRPERSLHFSRPEPTPLNQTSALYAVDVPRVVEMLEEIHEQARHAPLEDMASALEYIEKVAERGLFMIRRRPMTPETNVQPHECGRCEDGWVCEQHPDQPWPHGDCAGPGELCPDCRGGVVAIRGDR